MSNLVINTSVTTSYKSTGPDYFDAFNHDLPVRQESANVDRELEKLRGTISSFDHHCKQETFSFTIFLNVPIRFRYKFYYVKHALYFARLVLRNYDNICVQR